MQKLSLLLVILGWNIIFTLDVMATENPSDTYSYRESCPQQPNGPDSAGFAMCNCTSYVSDKLNQLWSQAPDFSNQYYKYRWGDARLWSNVAIKYGGIGVTGARDNFVWDEARYNAVFPGDVAWWDKWEKNPYGHVAFVENVEPDSYGRGVRCVTISEYNWGIRQSDGTIDKAFDFRSRRVCKTDSGHNFPDAFLHIDQDHIYCLQHPENCPNFSSMLATKDDRVTGRGGGFDPFNLKLEFNIVDSSSGQEWVAGRDTLAYGQVLKLRAKVKAKDGNARDHMRNGKDTIEVDYYVQQGLDDWVFLGREYTQATYLDNGESHTETVTYVVPNTNGQELSFKVKIDAEDEAIESHEGDNWSGIETFSVSATKKRKTGLPIATLLEIISD